jgi:hypothetical protein
MSRIAPRDGMLAFVLTGVLMVVYGSCVPVELAPGDGAELAYGMKYFAPVHPPGYPLYRVLGHTFVDLLGFNFVVGPHYFSGVAMAAALGCFYLYIRQRRIGLDVSLVATILLAVSPPVWVLATQAEVYALSLLFFTVTLLLWDGALRTGNGLFLLWFWVGLSLTHHPIGLINVPLAIHATRKIGSGSVRRLMPFFVLPGSLYLLLAVPPEAPPFNWPLTPNLSGIISHMLGGSFTRFFLEQGLWTPVVQGGRIILAHFSVVPFLLLIPLVVGLWVLKGREWMLLWVQGGGLVFLSFYGVPDLRDFLLPFYAMTVIFAARGYNWLRRRVRSKWLIAGLGAGCIASVFVFSVMIDMPYDRSVSIDRDYARGLDQRLKRGTVVSDWSHYTVLRFYQLDRGWFRDVRLVVLPAGYDLVSLVERHRGHDIPLYSTVGHYWKQSREYDLNPVERGLYRVVP